MKLQRKENAQPCREEEAIHFRSSHVILWLLIHLFRCGPLVASTTPQYTFPTQPTCLKTLVTNLVVTVRTKCHHCANKWMGRGVTTSTTWGTLGVTSGGDRKNIAIYFDNWISLNSISLALSPMYLGGDSVVSMLKSNSQKWDGDLIHVPSALQWLLPLTDFIKGHTIARARSSSKSKRHKQVNITLIFYTLKPLWVKAFGNVRMVDQIR
ncbi:hypothetical protein F8388_020166 [Cannabis sativa]|uniref:Uncharacterized protein n=1 Tax=Cannabis sativa TaxID=3483 RepID=A0A7J6FLG1_CANSA|nr:hypothetical protein F8388_020166 [Cannabis sativa]